MNHIAHDNIFEYLAIDLDMEEDDLMTKLRTMGTSSFIQYLKDQGTSLYSMHTVLSTELRDIIGSVLINKGIPLDKYLDTLLDRYVHDEYFTTTPFSIESSDEIIKTYREKATVKVKTSIRNTVQKQDKYKSFYKKVRTKKIKAEEHVESFFSTLLSNTDGITFLIRMLKQIDFHKEAFAQTTNSTYICLTLSQMHASKSKSIDQRTFFQKVACTAFLQNSALFTGLVSSKTNPYEKCKKSAQIVARLCKDEGVAEAISNRHSYTDEDGRPVFDNINNRNNFYMNVLMTVNLFIDIIKKNRYGPESIEVHKAMYELADQGYADKNIVSLIGELFLPKVKAQLLEYAYAIQNQCVEKPTIWGVAGDMLPIKFICDKKDCTHAGLHKTLVPQDIEIVTEEFTAASTKGGIYYTCEKLTNRLQIKYKGLQKKTN